MEITKCPYCHEDVQQDFNICPYCGEPLNDLARNLLTKKEKNAQMKLLTALIDKTHDDETLKLLKNVVDRLSK